MSLQWYVIRTEPRVEFQAAEALKRDGYEIFCPRIQNFSAEVRDYIAPLLPGYLFLRWDREISDWPTFRSGIKVKGWLKFGEDIPWVPDDVVWKLSTAHDLRNKNGVMLADLSAGDKVRVTSRSFNHIAEVLEQAHSHTGSIKVLMQFMGGLIRAQVPIDTLAPVSEGQKLMISSNRRTRGKGRWIKGIQPS